MNVKILNLIETAALLNVSPKFLKQRCPSRIGKSFMKMYKFIQSLANDRTCSFNKFIKVYKKMHYLKQNIFLNWM